LTTADFDTAADFITALVLKGCGVRKPESRAK
jgi:hypothetical protein